MEKEKKEIATAEKPKELVKQKQVADYSLGIFGTSDNFELAQRMALALSESTIVPQQFQRNVANCLIAIEQAQRLNTSPMMVMQNMYVIQNRPTWSASFLIAAINASKKYDMELQFDEKTDSEGKPYSCTCWTKKDDRTVTGMTVTMDIAKAEGWTAKNGSKWKTMPQLMLRYRAASFFARLNCPELTLGLYTKDEVIESDFKEVKATKTSSLKDALKEDTEVADIVIEDTDVVEE